MSTANEEDIEAFRLRCRAFLEEHALDEAPSRRDDPRGTAATAAARAFQGELYAAGLAGLTYPVEYGGQGLSQRHEQIWREEAAGFSLPTATLAITHGMCLPVLAEFGTPEQKSRYMADLISAKEVWCQMFSEPGAGSDVASLSTRAVRDGDEWVINGQKVWTSIAQLSAFGMLLARSDPDVPKHEGLSYFIMDMRAPGVDIRPLRQLTGSSEFNEVFLSDVRIPDTNRVGDVGDGWRCARTTLMK